MQVSKRYGWLALLFTLTAVALGQENSQKLQHYLDDSVDWYQRIIALDPTPINAQDLLFRQTVRDAARQAIGKGFEFARTQAEVITRTLPKTANTQPLTGPAQQLPQYIASTDAQITQLTAQVQDAAVAAQNTKPPNQPAARALQYKLQAQLNLANAQSAVLHNYADFLASSGSGTTSLSDRIAELQRSVPETDLTATTRPATITPPLGPRDTNGLVALISDLFTLTRRMTELTQLIDQAKTLEAKNDELHAPIRAQIMDVFHKGAAFAATTQPSTLPSALNAQGQELDQLATTVQEMSAVGLAMSQQRADLSTVEQSLSNWRSALAREYEDDIRQLIFRVVTVAAVILLIVVISEVWRRATYKYIHDTRRRRGLMMVRRIVMGFFVLLVVIASFVTEIGSLATFAGLITAGIAVSLQTVILSGVAYFFFIGRFGVRVGDRVTISGITGDVVEVGLFRLYLMELSGKAGDLHSTGRMIVFSNAVVFQPSAFYKQLPGADYVWHEVAMTLSPDGDHELAEKRLMQAVQKVFENYRTAVEAQYEESMQALHVTLEPPRPEGRLRFVDVGVEYVIRYPVELEQASQTDDQITRALLEAINHEPKLKFAASATPKIQVTG